MQPSVWTSLEIAKLCVSGLTPVLIVLIGLAIQRTTKRFDHRIWRSQKLVEKRLAVYDDIAPLLNTVMCYFVCIGEWREIEPPTIVSLKRTLDKKIHIAAPLFSQEFFVACIGFQQLCFATYNGWGIDALLRTPFELRKELFGQAWKQEWNGLFSTQLSDPNAIRDAYRRAINIMAKDIGVSDQAIVPDVGHSGLPW